MPKTLLPTEFRGAIPVPKYREDDPQALHAGWKNAHSLRDPELLAIDPEAFVVPIETALYLYRRNPGQLRTLVLHSLGDETAYDFWMHLSAAARDAFSHSDYELLGQLGFRMECTLAERAVLQAGPWSRALSEQIRKQEQAREEQKSIRFHPLSADKLVPKLIGAFDWAINRSHRRITPRNVSLAAIGYLEAVPPTMLMPPGLQSAESGADSPWSLLRLFLAEDPAVLKCVPEIAGRFNELRNPWLKQRLQLLPKQVADPDPRVKALRNPFAKLAAGCAAEKVRAVRQQQQQPVDLADDLLSADPAEAHLEKSSGTGTQSRQGRWIADLVAEESLDGE